MRSLFPNNNINYTNSRHRSRNLTRNINDPFSTNSSSFQFIRNLLRRRRNNRNFINIVRNYVPLHSQSSQEDVKMILSDEQIEKLECYKYKDIKEQSESNCCSISLVEYKDEDDVIILPCKHMFSKNSIIHWLKNECNKCPICREEVAPGNPNHTIQI